MLLQRLARPQAAAAAASGLRAVSANPTPAIQAKKTSASLYKASSASASTSAASVSVSPPPPPSSSSSSFSRPSQQIRNFHKLPRLRHEALFAEHGVPWLMTPIAFKFAWTDYQQLMVDGINRLTINTPDENSSVLTLVTSYARDPNRASLFNHASMAYNNHFFFECLSPEPVNIPDPLQEAMDRSTSPDSLPLKDQFLAVAGDMFGPGFVWLVKEKETGLIRILKTLVAGSPLPHAHFRRQSFNMANYSLDTLVRTESPAQSVNRLSLGHEQQRMSNGAVADAVIANDALDVTPLLCVNTWDHVWLPDWGILGKEQYLERWWDMVDWNVVAQNYLRGS